MLTCLTERIEYRDLWEARFGVTIRALLSIGVRNRTPYFPCWTRKLESCSPLSFLIDSLHNVTMLLQIPATIPLSLTTLVSCSSYPNVSTAGGGPPNSPIPAEMSTNGVKAVQLTQFLENLEDSFFSAGSRNLSKWDTKEYPNSSLDTASIINVISCLA